MKSPPVREDPTEVSRRQKLTTPQPTRGRYYGVHRGGPTDIEAIAERVKLSPLIIKQSQFNRERYYDSEEKQWTLAAQVKRSTVPLPLWIPEGFGGIEVDAPEPDPSLRVIDASTPAQGGFDIWQATTASLDVTSDKHYRPTHDGRVLNVISPDVEATANVSIKAASGVSDAELDGWKIGLTRTCREDYSEAHYDKSLVWDRMTDVSNGPVLDILTKRTAPFEGNSLPGSALRNQSVSMSIHDRLTDSTPLFNPLTHHDCNPADKLRSMTRHLEFTTHVIAFNSQLGQVRPLAFAWYTQEMTVAVRGLRFDDTKGRLAAGSEPQYVVSPHGAAKVIAAGQGVGPFAPEVSTRADKVANNYPPKKVMVEKARC